MKHLNKTGLVLLLLLAFGVIVLTSLAGVERRLPDENRLPPGSNVVLIVCDTLRADHLGLYGYPRPTSPFLDGLAEQAWVYENAYSHYSYTWPSKIGRAHV